MLTSIHDDGCDHFEVIGSSADPKNLFFTNNSKTKGRGKADGL